MITFKCPDCGEKMEVSDRKAGMDVECVRCGEMVEVPGQAPRKPRPAGQQKDIFTREHLTMIEFILAIVIFLPMVGCNLFIGGMAYFILNEKYPTKAYQILQAAMIAFGIVFLSGCLLSCILGIAGSRPPAPPPRQMLRP